MKNSAFLLSLFFLFLWTPVNAQVAELPLMPASGVVSYGNYPIDQLNRAHRQQLTGQFEAALLTYNGALAFQPNWVPALTARAELLYRLGRGLEAQRDHSLARRADATATAFFLARGHNGLLPFLALYPHDWYGERYGFEEELNLPGGAPTTPQSYFTHQYFRITEALDTALAVRLLQEKVDQNVLASQRLLDELPRGYNPAVRRMLEANLAMLNHDYREAVNLYTDATTQTLDDWPEINYNRGLGYILLHDYMNGCADLSQASRSGFAPASAMYRSLCNL